MTNKTYTVPDISCGHCVATIRRELALTPGVQIVSANADTKKISLEADTDDILRKAERVLTEIGYPPIT